MDHICGSNIHLLEGDLTVLKSLLHFRVEYFVERFKENNEMRKFLFLTKNVYLSSFSLKKDEHVLFFWVCCVYELKNKINKSL